MAVGVGVGPPVGEGMGVRAGLGVGVEILAIGVGVRVGVKTETSVELLICAPSTFVLDFISLVGEEETRVIVEPSKNPQIKNTIKIPILGMG